MIAHKKKIGVIGGAGPMASALLYNKIVEQCYKKVNSAEEFPEILIMNYPFSPGRKNKDSNQLHDTLVYELGYCIKTLINFNVDTIAIACNTLHLFLENIQINQSKVIHLIDLVKRKVKEQNLTKVLILGTQTTIQKKLYEESSYDFFYLNSTNQALLDSIIERILSGIVIKDDAQKLETIIKNMHKETVFDGVIFGCTDLSIVSNKFHFSLPANVTLLDTISILAEELTKDSE